jgi:hypothetical protein
MSILHEAHVRAVIAEREQAARLDARRARALAVRRRVARRHASARLIRRLFLATR